MKKTGIVTLQDSDNYGAVLQAFALQETLKELGADAYELGTEQKKETPAVEGRTLPPAIRRLREEGERRHRHFEAFREQYLHILPPDGAMIRETDLFITGSDQVWNPAVTGGDPRYFLPFASPEKRASYAASFGEDPREETLPALAEALSGLRWLSVREESGARLIGRLLNREAETCVDPVLLLPAETWSRMAGPKLSPDPYDLLIMVQNDPELAEHAKDKAARSGRRLEAVTASWYPPLGYEPWAGVCVPGWLALIRDAKSVISSSYHGLLFAMIFGRPYEAAGLGGGLEPRNARIREILAALGQDSRGAGWKTESVVQERRERSRKYLERLLDEAGG